MVLAKSFSMKKLLFLVFLLPLICLSQHTLTVKAEGLRSSKGLIAVGVYNTAETFLEEGKTFTGVFETAKTGTTTILIPDLPDGTYAVSIFHDENGNKKLDTNFMGIPKEPVAFSKAKMKTFGPPSFEECAFDLKGDLEIRIAFKE